MDHGPNKDRETNRRAKASWLSIITFFYNYKLLKKGRKHELKDKDIYKVLPEFEAEHLGNILETQWKKDCQRGTQLWNTLVKCFGLTYLTYTIIQLVFGTTMILFQPYVFSKFVAYFQPNQTSIKTWDAYMFAGAIGGLLLLNVFFLHNFAQLVTEYYLKIRTAVCSLIFRKALRVSPRALTIGKVVTLITKDVFAIDAALNFIKDMFIGFLQLTVVTCLLYERVGNSAFPPIAVIIFIIPIQLIIGRFASNGRLRTAKRTDERFRLTQEVLSSIKIVKMYSWQDYFQSLIGEARLLETNKLAIVYYLKALIGWLGAFTINLAFYILLVSYIAQGHIFQAETVYFVQQCLFTLRTAVMVSIPMGICNSADLRASFQRIQSFLDTKEVSTIQPTNKPPNVYLNKVQVADILQSVSVALDAGLLLVTGSLGGGKSVLLKTILGEYPIKSGQMNVNGTISYAPEKPWIFPGSIRQNILFGEPYCQLRYKQVLQVCALTYDLSKMEYQDNTIVGDNGVNLSKGQQARISLARAIYRNSDIYLLDDCLSSLDINVSDHIFKYCIKDFLKDKLCIFVTNKIHMISQMSGNKILFLENGTTLTLEQQNGGLDKRITYYIDEEVNLQTKEARKSFVARNEKYFDDLEEEETEELLGNRKDDMMKANIYEEGHKIGGVLWANYATYFRLMGGCLVFVYLIVAFASSQAAFSYSEKVISIWVTLEPTIATYITQNQTGSPEYEDAMKSRDFYLKIYTILMITAMVVSIVRSYSTFYACLNAAKHLHDLLLKALLQAKMSFFDSHYIGNIINRLSKDLYVVDEYMPFLIFDLFRLFFSFAGVILLIASVNWLLLIPGALLIVKFYFVQKLYLPAGRSLRRLEAASRSPIIGYLNAALEGLSIIRTSQQQNKLQSEFDHHQDLYTSAYYMNQTTLRFFAFILDIFGAFFVMGILAKLIFFATGETSGDVGLVISQAIMLSSILQYAVKQIAELETVMTSIERILDYTEATPEPKNGTTYSPWPVKGKIAFKNVSLTYSEYNEKRVLKDISFEIDAGNKVSIVGRTGAGKSSMLSSIFRLYDYSGEIAIDDEDISKLSIDFLRSHITIIPQDPILFSGSIRSNLDPFKRFSDEQIWIALENVHVKPLVTNLDANVASQSFSSGEKQLLCLARALILQNKIIILDEATANLDADMDLLLQKTFQNCFRHCTVIVIAHKLHSVIWCDKVLTLNDGSLIEYDETKVLLKNKDGILNKMVREENFETFVRLSHI